MLIVDLLKWNVYVRKKQKVKNF